ncbi:hypothetical protein AVEN_47183-1 [Araneus ventricosus]|uniref:Uncharacterized protein n=1 Tax=Araneus ventricosus TaxID=182803 RepID=A0A4Y2EDH9_ARAVE|nr:hypothetical protein AVEN_47183-1 [Araneus ventricosus]
MQQVKKGRDVTGQLKTTCSSDMDSLVIITSRFEATRGPFWDGHRNLEPLSNHGDDTRAGSPSPNFRTTPAEGRLTPYARFNLQKAQNATNLQWN